MRAAFVFLPLMFHACSQPAKGQQNAFAGTVDIGPSSNSAFVADSGANEIVSRLLAENERRKERLQGYTVIRTYEIKSREGKMAAQSVARMEYRAPDAKTFEKTSEQGSAIVRRLVFDELMDSESQSSSGKQREDSALTPVNYVFHFAGKRTLDPIIALCFGWCRGAWTSFCSKGESGSKVMILRSPRLRGTPRKSFPSGLSKRILFVSIKEWTDSGYPSATKRRWT
jgi:hypothetical protein